MANARRDAVEFSRRKVARKTKTPAKAGVRERNLALDYWRYCWMRVVRRPARPC
jgi:hypothetical protein